MSTNLNRQMNDMIRRAAGRMPEPEPQPEATQTVGHGSADGGEGANWANTYRPTASNIINQAIRDVARGKHGGGQ